MFVNATIHFCAGKNVLLILSWTNDSLILSKINNGKNDSVDL